MTRNSSPTVQAPQSVNESVEHTKKQACLYVVATPIGNLDDMTARALTILQQVDRIAAEDTRLTQKLLQHFGIQSPLISLHDHNEEARSKQLVSFLERGESLALVSDAGTPLISDPGYSLVRQVRAGGFSVVPIPGVSALIAALSVAGLPTDRFYFAGFLPAKSQARSKQLEELKLQQGTLIFYESPHRILASLQTMVDVLGGERPACLAREITKRYETFLHAPLAELLQQVQADSNQQRGELVVMVEGYQGVQDAEDWSEACRWLGELKNEMPPSRACALVAKMTGVKKKPLYAWMLAQEAAGKA
ncbi:16S rRNA (cytidine1402-2'-O)-methyltransferase [Marinospirillum celere]|uniref:Ribosomal RNA small subunit methyltransferase I n=1 Tax=Marinospirillum celere TaxID=1122252 RepID=A0A1I1FZF0_9GAMM|nr:16S rRNA (cytidine(1402)-2'-O)-methyltransferase [Marinospirillum celere]SFC04412.1 16S rRNA (cytidine1402-2'-O)-methyltransferase [Marinospirillum celere]